ncbi:MULTISPECIES: flavodoxin domain-containing protein [unclassified Cryobacterium]|uniref:flavodoxin domain-containing protein n=1 Tax=unclassified Cryobacterium TaxID=2649013 RepID=UPI000CE551E5|nr:MULTISPECIES: flavodoxin domain-containing protein [unclassified Cryobacterium]
MSTTVILYGTESGNAELVAEDLAAELEGEREVSVYDMSDFDVADFDAENFYLVVCSTHGDGELPGGATPLFEALNSERPNLSGIRYAMFGLGNSTYETYSQGSEIIDRRLTELGAKRVGVYGRHDACDGSLPNDGAVEWARELLVLV